MQGPLGTGPGRACQCSSPEATEEQAREPRPVAPSAITRKPLTPDSLVIYCEKCEFVEGGSGANDPRGSLIKKLVQAPSKDKTLEPPSITRVGEELGARAQEAAGTEPGPSEPRRGAALLPSLSGHPPWFRLCPRAQSCSGPGARGCSTIV